MWLCDVNLRRQSEDFAERMTTFMTNGRSEPQRYKPALLFWIGA